KGRLASPALTTAARRSVTRTVRFLEREAARLRAAADALVAATPALRADRGLAGVDPGGRAADRHHRPGRAAGGGRAPDRPVGSRLLRAGPAGVRQRGQRPEEDPAVEGGQPAAAQGAVPADPDGRPVQPPAPGVLRAAGRRRQAEDAGDRGLHAEAGDDRLRGAQEPRPVRPGLVVKNHPLTTRYLVRPHPRVWRFAYLLTAS